MLIAAARADQQLSFGLEWRSRRIVYLDGSPELLFGVAREALIADPDAWLKSLDALDCVTLGDLRDDLRARGRVLRIVSALGGDGRRRTLRCVAQRMQFEGRDMVAGSVVEVQGLEGASGAVNPFRAAVEHAHGGLAVADAEGRFVYVNREHCEIFGYESADELMGKSWQVLYSEDAARHLAEVEFPRLLAEGQWRGEVIAQRKDGSRFHLALSVSVLPGGGFVSNCEDATEQVEMKRRLRDSEAMFRLFLNTLPTAVTIRNLTGDYEFVNTATTDFLGKEKTLLGARTGMEVCLTADRAFAYWGAVDQRVATTGEQVRFDFPINWGGRDWVLDVEKLPLRINSDAVTHVCTLINDVTDARRWAKESEEHTRRLDAYHVMQREFISMVSHEFRTPLTSIQGVHYLLAKKSEALPPKLHDDFKRLLGMQEQALGTLKELVDQVLLLNRIEHMSTDTVPRSVALEEFVRRIVTNLNVSLAAERIRLEVKLPEGYAAALDEGQVRAALENLISNALKYSPEQALVDVHVTEAGESWCVAVSDRGRGIPEADRQKLFQPFHRASNVGRVPGTGLGLTIIRRVVDFHQGTLDFTSEVGVGTTFSLTFPRLFAPKAPPVAGGPGTALPFSKPNPGPP
jgi:PAS domain S-box-containing protein